MNRKIIIEGAKELGRVALLAAIPVIIVAVETNNFDYRLVGAVAVVAVLKAADKMLHKAGKARKNKRMVKGITRF